MKLLDKYEIYRRDEHNICIREYKETFVLNKETNEKESNGYSWVDIKAYFGTLKQALMWLKEKIIRDHLNELEYKDILMLIYQLEDALSETKIADLQE